MELSGLLDCTVADRDPDSIHPPRQHLCHTDTISNNYSTSQPTSTNHPSRPAAIRVDMAAIPAENTARGASAPTSNDGSVSPHLSATPKCVAFELLFPESPQYRARLPMRVRIYPHDTTESIVTTVKNFYGLYSSPTTSKGVSFEDEQGNTLIARYENFSDNMVVYVRVNEEPLQPHPSQSPVGAAAAPHHHGEAYPLPAPVAYGPNISRPNSRTSRRRSPSPNSTPGRRSASAGTNPAPSKSGRSRSSKTLAAGSQNNGDGYDSVNGYSSGDGGPGSSSGRAKEHLSNTEISVANIVEGGRRKRAKFESSVSCRLATAFLGCLGDHELPR